MAGRGPSAIPLRAGARRGTRLGALLLHLAVGSPALSREPAPTVGPGVISGGPGRDCALTVDVPAGFAARSVEGRIVLRPVGQESRRSVHETTFAFIGPDDLPPLLTGSRAVGAVTARYHLSREAGGSGGDEFALVAVVPAAGGLIRMDAAVQDENRADFAPAWKALSSARCPPAFP